MSTEKRLGVWESRKVFHTVYFQHSDANTYASRDKRWTFFFLFNSSSHSPSVSLTFHPITLSSSNRRPSHLLVSSVDTVIDWTGRPNCIQLARDCSNVWGRKESIRKLIACKDINERERRGRYVLG